MNFLETYSILEAITESRRIISDPDVLYHFTNPTPLLNIINQNCLKSTVHLDAVCFTTDANYQIYEYPCGMQFSRSKLESHGYELVPFDEYEEISDMSSESEERVYEDITDVIECLTSVSINWNSIEIVQSKDGDRIADAVYIDQEEHESYDLRLDDFKAMLKTLSDHGIKVIENGAPRFGEYYLDDSGKLCYGNIQDVA